MKEVDDIKDIIAKLLLISIIVAAISAFIYDHQWENIKSADGRAVQYLNATNLPY